mmetsp:Transcript_7327/g.9271  ORF Transcript_7327/g.9271 Transcript_7327/m.9271 type:complete len:298 (-) Transcript_7327:218-1111(-)
MSKLLLDEPMLHKDLKREIKFIDRYLCLYIHNPIISSIVLISTCCFINGVQYYDIYVKSQWELIFIQDCIFDLLQNIINLIFILRFCMGKFGNTPMEVLLLMIENIGCFNLVFNQRYSLLMTNVNIVLKVFILWQILCPYFILTINLADYINWKIRDYKPQSLLDNNDVVLSFYELLIDTNNNFLPIFIAHSFVLIDLNFTFVTSEWIIFAYKISIFLLKFYCICRYILYETCYIVYNINFTECYEWIYNEVNANNKSQFFLNSNRNIQNKFLLAGVGICIGVNVLYIGSYYINLYL